MPAVGKDEVASSNLASSSRKTLEPQRLWGFCFSWEQTVLSEFVTVLFTWEHRVQRNNIVKQKEIKKLKNITKAVDFFKKIKYNSRKSKVPQFNILSA